MAGSKLLFDKYKVIGILGGMGPEATVDLYNHIIKLTPAVTDQDHIPTLIFSNPKIPDRSASIDSDNTKLIIKHLREGARILENGGADFIVIPCNTAHRFYRDVVDEVEIPVVHMIEETVKHIVHENNEVKEVGLLATSGTLKTDLFQDVLKKHTIVAEIPDDNTQNNMVMKAIYSIKSGGSLGEAEALLKKAIDTLPDSAKKNVIMGCTEIPLAIKGNYKNSNMINPTEILAKTAVRMSMQEE